MPRRARRRNAQPSRRPRGATQDARFRRLAAEYRAKHLPDWYERAFSEAYNSGARALEGISYERAQSSPAAWDEVLRPHFSPRFFARLTDGPAHDVLTKYEAAGGNVLALSHFLQVAFYQERLEDHHKAWARLRALEGAIQRVRELKPPVRDQILVDQLPHFQDRVRRLLTLGASRKERAAMFSGEPRKRGRPPGVPIPTILAAGLVHHLQAVRLPDPSGDARDLLTAVDPKEFPPNTTAHTLRVRVQTVPTDLAEKVHLLIS